MSVASIIDPATGHILPEYLPGSATGVVSIGAGTGITVGGTSTVPTVSTALTAGSGVSITGTSNLTIANTGVLSTSAGTGISVSGTASAPVINNSGVLSVTAGTGIGLGGTASAPVVSNTGVLTATAGTGIILGGTASAPIINNSGVLSVSAGTGVSITGTASAPIINATGTTPVSYYRLPADSAFTAPSGTVSCPGSAGLTNISANFTITAGHFYRITGTMSLSATATTDQIGIFLNGVSLGWWVWTPSSTEIPPTGTYSVGWTTFFKAETSTTTGIVLQNNQSVPVDVTLDVVSGAVPGFLIEEWATLPNKT
jgi:hypothetical protein